MKNPINETTAITPKIYLVRIHSGQARRFKRLSNKIANKIIALALKKKQSQNDLHIYFYTYL